MNINVDENRMATLGERSVGELSINTIRTLSIDAVQQAASGHPGRQMELSDVILAAAKEQIA
jgi:transketolase